MVFPKEYLEKVDFDKNQQNTKQNKNTKDAKRLMLRGCCFHVKYFLYKKMAFFQGDGNLWPYCCMNNLYISHRSLTPEHKLLCYRQDAYQSFFEILSF